MRIAVLISSLLFDTQKAFMKGIERRVRDYKDVCSVFACHTNAGLNEKHTHGEYAIFDLPDFDKFDGVVYVKNTFRSSPAEDKIEKRLKESHTKVVVIDGKMDGFVNIISDEYAIMKCAVDHLIEQHDCKRIGFLGGHTSSDDTTDRFNGYLASLEQHGLEYHSDYRIDGNYQFFSGAKAADHFINLEGGIPDAIACANDEMAIGLCTELRKRGVKIPRGCKIVGVDYDSVSRVYAPRLTTVKRQQYQKGVSAVTVLHEYSEHTAGEVITLETSLVCGETCGCKPELPPVDPNTINAIASEKYVSEELSQYSRALNADFMPCADTNALMAEIRRRTEQMDVDELYLCLNNYPMPSMEYTEYIKELGEIDRAKQSGYLENVIAAVKCINGKCAPKEENEIFPSKDMFPPSANGGKEGGTYYFFPIHFMDRNFGYAISGTSGDPVRNDFVPSWAHAVSVAIENTRKRALLVRMIDTLDKMWIYDTLSDLYNRAGFFKVTSDKFEKCVASKTPVAVIFMDADGLKKVNDLWGHEEGDNLIKGISYAIREASDTRTENYMRYGGDEFVVTIIDGTEEKVASWKERFNEKLAEAEAKDNKPYKMEVSIGYKITTLDSVDDLSKLFDEADKDMYIQKKSKRSI